jgi:hypothetical protein
MIGTDMTGNIATKFVITVYTYIGIMCVAVTTDSMVLVVDPVS